MDNVKMIVCKRCGLFQEEPVVKRRGVHLTAYCSGCEEYIQHIRQARPVLHFGKYKGRLINEIAQSDPAYLKWLIEQNIKEGLRKNINEALAVEVQG